MRAVEVAAIGITIVVLSAGLAFTFQTLRPAVRTTTDFMTSTIGTTLTETSTETTTTTTLVSTPNESLLIFQMADYPNAQNGDDVAPTLHYGNSVCYAIWGNPCQDWPNGGGYVTIYWNATGRIQWWVWSYPTGTDPMQACFPVAGWNFTCSVPYITVPVQNSGNVTFGVTPGNQYYWFGENIDSKPVSATWKIMYDDIMAFGSFTSATQISISSDICSVSAGTCTVYFQNTGTSTGSISGVAISYGGLGYTALVCPTAVTVPAGGGAVSMTCKDAATAAPFTGAATNEAYTLEATTSSGGQALGAGAFVS